MSSTFQELGLDEQFCERLTQKGISSPTEIQQSVFPRVRDGKSVLGLSKTGSGKTLAYLMPIIQGLKEKNLVSTESQILGPEANSRVLVLVPTRELAYQVSQSVSLLLPQKELSVIIIGGESEDEQIRKAAEAVFVIATPGRFLDLARRNMIKTANVKTIVFDEADRLLDMGFIDDIRELVKMLPKPEQMMFFSATLHIGVEEMAYEFGVDFERFDIQRDEMTVEGLDHRVAFVGDEEKFHALANYLAKSKGRAIIFSNYRERAHDICQRLRSLRYSVDALTAQLNQSQRTRIMESFREGKTKVLVASDLAARGLDVFDIDFVVNFDLPEDPATYVHRVGRTARAGRSGEAISFVGFDDSFRLERIERFLGKPIVRVAFTAEELSGPLPRSKDAPPESAQTERHYDQPRHSNGHHQARHQAPRQSHSSAAPKQHANASPKASQVVVRSAVRPNIFAKVWTSFLALFGLKKASAVAAHKASNPQSSAGTAQSRPHSSGGGSNRGGYKGSRSGGQGSGGHRSHHGGGGQSGGGRRPHPGGGSGGRSSGGGRSGGGRTR